MHTKEKTRSPLGIRAGVLGYLQYKPYMVALILTAIGCYGFLMTHFTVSVDALQGQRYYEGTDLIAVGRISALFVYRLFPYLFDHTNLSAFFGVVALLVSAILFCILFDQRVKTKNKIPQMLFSCLFISYPLHSEIFCYKGAMLGIPIGFVFVALSVFLMDRFAREKRVGDMVMTTLCLAFLISWTEGLIPIYVALVFALFLLEMLSEKQASPSFKAFFRRTVQYMLPLAAAIILEWAVTNAIIWRLQLERTTYAANTILWDFTSFSSVVEGATALWTGIKRSLFVYMFFRFPVAVYVAALLLTFFLMLFHAFRYKSLAMVCAYVGLVASTFALSIIQGREMLLRTCQVYSFFIAFIAFLLVYLLSRKEATQWRRYAYQTVSLGLAVLAFVQVVNIDYWFELDYKRYEQERRTVEEIGFVLNREHDVSKPVVFAGEYGLSSYINSRKLAAVEANGRIVRLLQSIPALKEPSSFLTERRTTIIEVPESIILSYIWWSKYAFDDPYVELFPFFEFCGFSILKGTAEQYQAAQVIAQEMPPWPAEGSIRDCGEFLIVNFGQ